MEEKEETSDEKVDIKDEKPKEFESRIPKRTPERKGKDPIKVK